MVSETSGSGVTFPLSSPVEFWEPVNETDNRQVNRTKFYFACTWGLHRKAEDRVDPGAYIPTTSTGGNKRWRSD